MNLDKNENNSAFEESASKSCRVDETLGEAIARCLEQISYESISKEDKDIARELCLIMAEVRRLAQKEYIKIDKAYHTAEDVSKVFEFITKEHIDNVIRKNSERNYAVKYRKAYLRTLLYNSVFELSSEKTEDY